jgi:hypothetical protein
LLLLLLLLLLLSLLLLLLLLFAVVCCCLCCRCGCRSNRFSPFKILVLIFRSEERQSEICLPGDSIGAGDGGRRGAVHIANDSRQPRPTGQDHVVHIARGQVRTKFTLFLFIFSVLLTLRFVNVKILRKELLGHGIRNIRTTAFYQGNTSRWAIAWSFLEREHTEREAGMNFHCVVVLSYLDNFNLNLDTYSFFLTSFSLFLFISTTLMN